MKKTVIALIVAIFLIALLSFSWDWKPMQNLSFVLWEF